MAKDNPLDDQVKAPAEVIRADLYAVEVLESARVLVDQALTGHRDLEAVIDWLWNYTLNARLTYRWAHEAAA